MPMTRWGFYPDEHKIMMHKEKPVDVGLNDGKTVWREFYHWWRIFLANTNRREDHFLSLDFEFSPMRQTFSSYAGCWPEHRQMIATVYLQAKPK